MINSNSNNQDFPAPRVVNLQGVSYYDRIMKFHPPSWSDFFKSVEVEVRHACTQIQDGSTIFPAIPNVINAFFLCPFPMLRCVIIGQDPYPGRASNGQPRASGYCFGSEWYNDMPKSLIPIYDELERTVEDWKRPSHPDLRYWARQGVLMLNVALTVKEGAPNSHSGPWKPFTEKLMEYINENAKDVVFLLWGRVAEKAADTIHVPRHYKLVTGHPSPMNQGKEGFTFKGCDHFNLANIELVRRGIEPIDWRLP